MKRVNFIKKRLLRAIVSADKKGNISLEWVHHGVPAQINKNKEGNKKNKNIVDSLLPNQRKERKIF